MRLTGWRLTSILLLGCTSVPPSAETAAGLGEGDGGVTTSSTYASGARIYGESSRGGTPVLLGHWEAPQPGVFRLGQGHGTLAFSPLPVLQFDADDKIGFMLNGGPVMKLQDHPMVGPLLHLSEVSNLWFGNTLDGQANFIYQGTTLGGGEVAGNLMFIRGQSVSGTASATRVSGGDVEVRAGDASSVSGAPRDPGEVIVGGGRVGYEVRGNVALHDRPSDWCQMEGGLYVHDALSIPERTPSGGGFLYAHGGALYWRGSGGTVTQLAPP